MKRYLSKFILSLLTFLVFGSLAFSQTTFNYTGGMQTFTAPATGNYQFDCWGAQGGSGLSTTGGLGGFVTGVYSLTAGQTINIFVGGQGGSYAGPIGWNGGGQGGIDTVGQNGGSGGGASDIRVSGTAFGNRIIVAGGGAGGGRDGSTGNGGGLIGTSSSDFIGYGFGGTGGTQSAGGVAYTTTRGATNGTLGIGGAGSTNFNSAGGGGGGGGYFGGGGGTSTVDHGSGFSSGGGGGSSYIDGVTGSSTSTGVKTGNGQIIITSLCSPSTITPNIASLPDLTDQCSVVAPTAPTAIDDCGTIITGTTPTVFPITTQGTTIVTWSYTSGSVTTTQTQNVVIDDVTAPVADLVTLADVTAECSVTSLVAPTATDNCGGIVTVTNNAILPISGEGTTTVVTWTYNDGNGNTSTQTQNVIINDVTAPVITCPAPVSVNNDAGICGAVVNYTIPTFIDNCSAGSGGTLEVLFVDNYLLNTIEIPTVMASDGHNVTVVTDEVANGYSTLNGDLSAYDLIVWNAQWGYNAPVATINNIEAWVQAGGNILVTGYDVVFSPQITTFLGGSSGTDFGGNNILTVLGPGNNLTTGLFDITGTNIFAISDWDSLNAPYSAETVNIVGDGRWTLRTVVGGGQVAWLTGFYNEDGKWNTPGSGYYEALKNFAFNTNAPSTIITQTDVTGLTSGDVFPVGTTTLEYTATDAGGNTDVCTFNVTVTDNEAPVADIATLADVTAECSVTSLVAPSATDNCGGVVTVTNNAILPISGEGTTTVVTWTYNDGNGNTSTQTQNVIINDVTAPVADIATLADVTAECSVTSLVAPTATDNCGGVVTVTNNAILPISGEGTTTVVTWTYNDGNGNTSTQTQNVIINDITNPTVVGQNITVSLDSFGDASITASMIENGSVDNCGVASFSIDITSFNCSDEGINNVVLTVTDVNGNTSATTYQVIVLNTFGDNDTDGIKDNCDDDDDNDGVLDVNDNCPLDSNSDQADNDSDGMGDVCDDDDDNDGLIDTLDNCQFIYNPGQDDRDNDGIGDVCDLMEINVSEAITPNGDGINDTWMIYNIENYPNSSVRVFNRWGTEVFFAKGYQNDWNGAYKNNSQPLPDSGSYYYQIDLNGNGSTMKDGWIYITRK